MDNIKKNKKNIVNLLNKIYAIDGVISANIVGSFAQNKKLNDSIEKLIQTTNENNLVVAGASEETLLFTKQLKARADNI